MFFICPTLTTECFAVFIVQISKASTSVQSFNMADMFTELRQPDASRVKGNQGSIDTNKAKTRGKSRLGSYLATHRSNSSLERLDPQPFVRFVPRSGDHVYHPDPEQMITTMLTRLLCHPAEGLPPEHNSFLLHVFESYRSLRRELEVVQQRLDTETHAYQSLAAKSDRVEAVWLEGRQNQLAEIGRLQSLLAQQGFAVPIPSNPGCITLVEHGAAATCLLTEGTAGSAMSAKEQRIDGNHQTLDRIFVYCSFKENPELIK